MAINIKTIMIGVIVIVIAAIALGFVNIDDLNFLDKPDYACTSENFCYAKDATVTLAGKTYTANALFCKGTTSLPWNCGNPVNYACNTARNEQIDLFGGTCQFNSANDATCQNKWLEVCGSGTGNPTNTCEDNEQPVQLSGVVTVKNTKLSLASYNLLITKMSVDTLAIPQGILSESGKVQLDLYSGDGTHITGNSYDIKITNSIAALEQKVPYTLQYNIPNTDCNDQKIDDHTIKMTVKLYDEDNKLLSSDEFTVGQNKGTIIKAGW